MADDDRYDKKDDRPSNRGQKGPRKGGYNKGRGGYSAGGRKDFKPRDGKKRDFKPRDGDGEKREYRPREGGDRERREFRPRDGDRGNRDFRPRNGDRPRNDRRGGPGRNGGKRDFKPRDGDRREFRPREERSEEQRPMQEQKLTIPSTPQRILFKGVDCEVNGRADLAMVLYLHGAVMMSKGCENNALKMLREMGPGEFKTVRGRISKMCSDDAMIEYDYLCWTIDNSYNRLLVDSAAADGNPLAIYCRIRQEEIEGDDECIDVFASAIDSHPEMVEDGLKLLKRKKDSVKAEEHLLKNEEKKKLRQSIRSIFVKARKGDRGSAHKLEELSETFPEAGFLRGYLDAGDDAEEYLRRGYRSDLKDIIVNMESEFGIQDTPFGMFLKAKKLQRNEEEWIPLMIEAAKAGSDEAMEEVKPVEKRKDVRKSFSSI